jgi:DNA-binding NarL/FixJ family response regulator
MIRVAIIDDDPKTRKELAKVLQTDPGIQVVSKTGLSRIKEIEEQKPDVILLDSKKPFTDCLETTQSIIGRFDDARVIVLSMHSKNPLEGSLCQVGACFHLCRDCSAEDLLAAIRNGLQRA